MNWARILVAHGLRRGVVAVLVAGSVVVAGCGSAPGSVPEAGPGHRVAYSQRALRPTPHCNLGRLREQLAARASTDGVAGQVIDLQNVTGLACLIPTYLPTLRIGLGRSDYGPVGKGAPMPDELPARVLRSFFAPYRHSESFTLVPGKTASLVLLWALRGDCRNYGSVVLYQSNLAVGRGSVSSLPRPIRVCGTPFVLPYLSGSLGAALLSATIHLLAKKLIWVSRVILHLTT